MFKFLPVFLLGCLACTWSMPLAEEDKKPVEIISSVIDKAPDGSYLVSNESTDGTKREEKGTVEVDEEGNPYIEVRGFYTYINDVGETVRVDYTAGKNGFVPSGETINPDITNTAVAARDLPKFQPESQYGPL